MDKLKLPTGNIAENSKRWSMHLKYFLLLVDLGKRDMKKELKRYSENISLLLGIVKRHQGILASMCHELHVKIAEHLSTKGSLT